MQDSNVCANFILIGINSLEFLSSFVAYRATLFITCPKHTSSKWIGKYNALDEITNFRDVVMIAKLMPSSFT
jgi:hypothetical protein